MFPFIFAFLSIKLEDNVKNGEKLELSDEQKQKLDAAAKIEGFAEKFMNDFNTELEAGGDNAEAIAAIEAYMSASEEGEGADASEEEEEGAEASEEGKTGAKSASAMVKKLLSRTAKLEGTVKTAYRRQ